jgi:hypothetical protein
MSACDVNRSIDEVLVASSNPSLVSDNGISLRRATTTQEWSAQWNAPKIGKTKLLKHKS